MKNVLLIVGHSEEYKGARNYKGEYEYDFNLRIAKKVKKEIPIDYIIKNNDNSYPEVKNNYDIAIELHFNYFTGTANGCEALIIDAASKSLSDNLLEVLSSAFKLRNRGTKYLKPMDRGYYNLVKLAEFSKIQFLLEPCFQAEKAIFENEDEYALLLANFLSQYITIKKPEKGETLCKKLSTYLMALLRYLFPSLETRILRQE